MPYYSLQVTFATEEEGEEQLLEYLQDMGISFLEVLCHDKVSDPHFEAMVFGVSVFGRSVDAALGSILAQGRVSIQTSCPVPNEAWTGCVEPLALDKNIRQAQIAETRTPGGAEEAWLELRLDE
jgi:hypothetical protein